MDELVLTDMGNQRSSLAYADNRVYFTTVGGWLCAVEVHDDGTLGELISVKNTGVTTSTSTPVVYHGVVYYGANGKLVAADAATLKTLREVSLPATTECKTSVLLTTAYAAEENGAVYLYLTQNAKPGGLYVVKDTGSALELSVLYTPAQEEFNITSPICGSDGTVYFRNDAGYLIALEKRDNAICQVTFRVAPADAEVRIAGVPFTGGQTYALAAGSYTYSASKNGYTSKAAPFTISAEEASSGTKVIRVSLDAAPIIPKQIYVRVQVKTHDEAACGRTYTYKTNAAAYSNLADETVAIPSGSSVYDALDAALQQAGLPYAEGSSGYISAIDGIEEFGHNSAKSGWIYMVNGVVSSVGCRDKKLSLDSTVLWIYSDDYEKEYGSENLTIKDPKAIQTVVSAGEVSAVVSEQQMSSLISDAAGSLGNVVLRLMTEDTVTAATVTVNRTDLEKIFAETAAGLTIESPVGTIFVSRDALAAIIGQAGGSTVTVRIEEEPAEGRRTLLNQCGVVEETTAVVVRVNVKSNGSAIHTFGSGKLDIDVPVDPSFHGGKIYRAFLISDDGTVHQTCATVTEKYGRRRAAVETAHLSALLITSEQAAPFADVDRNAWYYDAVTYVVAGGLFQGVSETVFQPDGFMTRAMAVTVLYRLAGQPETEEKAMFSDTLEGSWYSSAVSWAAINGITQGYADGSFGLGDTVTRQQFVTMLWRYAQHQNADTAKRTALGAFRDAAQIAPWAQEAMQWACAEEILSGTTAETLEPLRKTSRAQTAAILLRFNRGTNA